jgi:hypothetical protein
MSAALYAIQGLTVLQALLSAGLQVAPLIQEMKSTLTAMKEEGRDPTPAEWDALAAQEQAASDALDAAAKR